jgi:poly-gamma-glutamate synthesis protein (capsule biosynthesis protein)
MFACYFSRRMTTPLAVTFAILLLLAAMTNAPAQQPANIPSLYPDSAPFLAAIDAERLPSKPDVKVTGISVPHHLLAADLIARGFWIASGNSYDRVILISPDHFSRSRRPFATTRLDIETPLGTSRTDKAIVEVLVANTKLFDDSDLFKQEHGIAALLPFVRHFFPAAPIVPIVVSYGSTRSDWDAAVTLLKQLVDPRTLIVQSTDYSHYLTHEVAIQRDQETLNVIAANDIDAIARLIQPDHMDSKGSQYIQMRLQAELKKARGTVIANRNSAEYSAFGKKTTSYDVTVYSIDAEDGAKFHYDDQSIVYFGGDVFVGRWFTPLLANPEVRDQVITRIRGLTSGQPLIINLEGVLLDDPPTGINPDLHVMHASLAIPILKALNVRAAGLANNHSHDLGESGFRESVQVLKRAGIAPLPHMQAVDLTDFGFTAINFIGVRDYRNYPVVKSTADLQQVCHMKVRAPLVALVHWGQEYTHTAQPGDYAAAHALHTCGVNIIVGAHSHQAARDIEAIQGGGFQMTYSLGNLLFDQKGDRVSGALLELRRFRQGTVATRLIPVPNLFDLAAGELAHKSTTSDSPEYAPPMPH